MARRKKDAQSSRLDRDNGDARVSRKSKDRKVTQNRELSDSERKAEFRNKFFQSSLPDLPPIPGYHVCWLTTQNPRDPIHGRLRLGYELINADDVPGWGHSTLKTGEYVGCIGVNEMLAAKIPLDLYQSYMEEVHHDQPREEEEKLSSATRQAEEAASQLTRKPVRFTEEEGLDDLGSYRHPNAPDFAKAAGDVRE
jgi:hypothetical protein